MGTAKIRYLLDLKLAVQGAKQAAVQAMCYSSNVPRLRQPRSDFNMPVRKQN